MFSQLKPSLIKLADIGGFCINRLYITVHAAASHLRVLAVFFDPEFLSGPCLFCHNLP